GGRLAEMLRFYATRHWGPNIRGRTTFKRRLDAARSFEDVLSCNEPDPPDTLTEVGRALAAAQADLKSAEASRTVMKKKLFAEQRARANAETCAQQFSADRDAAHLAIRSNEILTKEVNHGRAEYLVGIQAFKRSHENLHKILCQTDPKETTLTIKLRERNRDLVRRVKHLEKANSALSSRLRLEDMDPEALVPMVEGLELDKIDWEALSSDPQTRQALKAVYQVGLEDARDHDTLADDIARAKIRFVGDPSSPAHGLCLSTFHSRFGTFKSGSKRSAAGGGNSNTTAVSFAVNHADWAASCRWRRWVKLDFDTTFD
ncbi:hypothetical protein PHMEG_00033494, partial [Phytophthora megakarya]